MQVFNPPPGWPDFPDDWQPPQDWKPDSSWPEPPPGWQFKVEDTLRMRPITLSRPAPLPDPTYASEDQINAISQAAADAAAMEIAAYAAQTRQLPTSVLGNEHHIVETSISRARAYVFDDLIAESERRARALPSEGLSQSIALEHLQMIRALRDSFSTSAFQRISQILDACTVAPFQGDQAALSKKTLPSTASVPAVKAAGHADLLLTAVGLFALIDTFLPWYTLNMSFLGSQSANAWASGFGAWFPMVILVAMAGLSVLPALGVAVKLRGGYLVHAIAGIVATVVALIWLSTIGTHSFGGMYQGPDYGAFLGLGLTVAATALAFSRFVKSGGSLARAKDAFTKSKRPA